MGLIFFGNERLANSITESGVLLQSLLDADYEVTHVVINRHKRQSRKKQHDAVVEIAHQNDINVIDTWDEDYIVTLAKQSDAGVLASFGRIIKGPVINAFPHGILNIHPSLLPKYRGPTPIESAILGNNQITGVSLMALDSKLDAGNVYAKSEYIMRGDETKQELYETLAQKGADILIENLPSILSGANQGNPQNHKDATFTKIIIKSDGFIDWDLPAEAIERQIRAFTGWPGSKATIAGIDMTIIEASTIDESGTPGQYYAANKQIIVACGKGSLVINRLKPPGRSEMSSEAFLAGNKI